MRREFLNSQLIQKLNMLENPQEELGDYDPHEYAYEGEPVADPQLDAISIPGSDSDGNFLQNLHPKFRTLASICRPDLI
ncbi:hypothetical protein DKP78_15125 [Enterococcus faecium]|nr:hypothetical protein DKP78_15125 [Enterococcus faecium]